MQHGEHRKVKDGVHVLSSVDVPEVLVQPCLCGNPQGQRVHSGAQLMRRQTPAGVSLRVKLRIALAEIAVRDHFLLSRSAVGQVPDRPLRELSAHASAADEDPAVVAVRIGE